MMKLFVVLVSICSTTYGAFSPTWIDGAGSLTGCGKTTRVMGVAVCASEDAYTKTRVQLDHIVNVFYQLLDNDADGVADDPAVLKQMTDNKYVLWVPATEAEADNFPDLDVGVVQMTGSFEAFPNSCDIPSNRGASASDRTTWAAAVNAQTNCDPRRDASTEEILHLITMAAASLWPDKWAPAYTSAAGSAISLANGDCGWGYLKNYKNPQAKCTGYYAYDDETCDEGCVVIEGIYWAIVSYIGGVYTNTRAQAVANEWLMTTPDDNMASMALVPSGVSKATSLQTGSPQLYALVSDTTTTGHQWIPSVMPDGNYTATVPPTEATEATQVTEATSGCAADKNSECAYWQSNGYDCTDKWMQKNCATTCCEESSTGEGSMEYVQFRSNQRKGQCLDYRANRLVLKKCQDGQNSQNFVIGTGSMVVGYDGKCFSKKFTSGDCKSKSIQAASLEGDVHSLVVGKKCVRVNRKKKLQAKKCISKKKNQQFTIIRN